MLKQFFSFKPWHLQHGVTFLRLVVGLLMVYHGMEVFDSTLLKNYAAWPAFSTLKTPLVWIYVGKVAELVAGLFLTVGLATRLAAIILIGTMAFIIFFIGEGRIWYEEQHPFMFTLMGILFVFSGGGSFSIDGFLQQRKHQA